MVLVLVENDTRTGQIFNDTHTCSYTCLNASVGCTEVQCQKVLKARTQVCTGIKMEYANTKLLIIHIMSQRREGSGSALVLCMLR